MSKTSLSGETPNQNVKEFIEAIYDPSEQLSGASLLITLRQVASFAYEEGQKNALNSLMDSTELAAFFGVSEQQARKLIAKANKACGVGKRYGSPSKGLWLVSREDLPLIAPTNRGIRAQRNKAAIKQKRLEVTCRLCHKLLGWPVVQEKPSADKIFFCPHYALVRNGEVLVLDEEGKEFFFRPWESMGDAQRVYDALPSPKAVKQSEGGFLFCLFGEGWQGDWCDNGPEAIITAAINYLDTNQGTAVS